MASNIGDWMVGEIIDTLMIATQTPHIALHTAAVGDAGGGTEVAGDTYVRLPMAMDAEAARGTANTAAEEWAEAGAEWGTVGWVGIWDALSGGNLIAWGAVTTAKLITIGDTAIIAIGALTLTFTATP